MASTELTDYITFLTQRGKLPAAELYLSLLSGFENWLEIHYNRTIDSFTQNNVVLYIEIYENANTANAFLAALKGYCNYRVGELNQGDPRFNIEMQRLTQVKNIPRRRLRRKIEKVALEPIEVNRLLKRLRYDRVDDVMYAGAVVHFYFGARPIELAKFIETAKINWNAREMIILTAKTRNERYLAWHENLTPFLKLWYEHAPYPYPSEWLTKRLNKYRAGSLTITSKVARKTVQTQMRLHGVDDYIIDAILGHESKTSAIGDVYTDQTLLMPKIREALIDRHYLIANNII
jgi:integrase